LSTDEAGLRNADVQWKRIAVMLGRKGENM
jgi:hypothetical protein